MTKLEGYNWAVAVSESRMSNDDKAKNIAGIISQVEFSEANSQHRTKKIECKVLI